MRKQPNAGEISETVPIATVSPFNQSAISMEIGMLMLLLTQTHLLVHNAGAPPKTVENAAASTLLA